jgi:hypothetical protein
MIKCALFSLVTIQLASAYICNLTNCVYELRDTVTTFGKDLTSTPERIHLKTESFVIQDFKTFTPSLTASNKAFHMAKDLSKAMVKDPPYEDYLPLQPSYHKTSTEESTHIFLSQAALFFTSSQHSTQPCKVLICNDNLCLKTISHSRRSKLHLHAPPSDSVGNIDAYNHATITLLYSDLL